MPNEGARVMLCRQQGSHEGLGTCSDIHQLMVAGRPEAGGQFQAGNEKEEPDLRCRSGSCSAAGLRGREEPGATPRNRVNGDAAKRPWHVGQERD